MDDFSRATWVHLFSHKSNAFSLLTSLIAYVEKQFNVCVKSVRSDNVMEFGDKTTKAFYSSKGIMHQTKCVDTPQQNGVVERKHKHLLETARALYFLSKLPISYSGKCSLTAAYLINRFPLSSIQNKTPYEFLFQTSPYYDHLKCFGCLCYICTPKQHRLKFQPRAIPCVFIGYPFAKKAYKLLHLETNKKIFSRDVQFHETHFPFQTIHLKPDNTLLFPVQDLPHIIIPSQTPTTSIPSAPHIIDQYFPIFSDTLSSISDITESLSQHDHPHSPASLHIPKSTPISSPSTTVPQNNVVVPHVPALRRSTREHKTPAYLQHYHCNNISTASTPIPKHWRNLVSVAYIPSTTLPYLTESRSYQETSTYSYWIDSMNKEMQAL